MENTVVPPNAYVTYKDKKLFVCRHPTLGLRVGSGGGEGVILEKVTLIPRALPLFDISLVAGNITFIRNYRYYR